MLDLEKAKQELGKAPARDPSSRTERLRLLLLHSKDFYRQNPKQAEKWAREALALAEKLRDAEGVARAHYYIGRALYSLSQYESAAKEFQTAMELDRPNFELPLNEGPLFSLGLALAEQGKYNEAITNYEQALQQSREHHRQSEIDILTAMGNAALEQGDYPKALQYQYDSLAVLDKSEEPLRHSIVLANIGRIYIEVEDLDKADNFLGRSILLKKEIADVPGLDTALYNRGIIAYKRGDRKAARKLYTHALEAASSIGSKESQAYIEDALGNIELDEGHVQLAADHFSHSVAIASSLSLRWLWCSSLIGEGRSLIALKHPEKAIEKLSESLAMAEESELLPLQCQCASALAKAYEAGGKLKESIVYFNKFIALNAAVHSEQKQRTLVEISARVEIEKADHERARMEQLAKNADEQAKLLREEAERQSKELTALALQLVERNEFLCTLKEELEPIIKPPRVSKEIAGRIDDHIKSDRDWETFEHQFNQIHRAFIVKLAAAFPTLTPMEIKIAVFLRLGLSTKAMASLLCLSTRTVENHRRSLRKKLALPSEENLVAVLNGFGEEK